ncbi:MAG: hypothetical protein ABIN17_01870 [candidate division WOR-3 bacterium]
MECERLNQWILKETLEKEDWEHIYGCSFCKSFFNISDFLHKSFEDLKNLEPDEEAFLAIKKRIRFEKVFVRTLFFYMLSFSLLINFFFFIIKNIFITLFINFLLSIINIKNLLEKLLFFFIKFKPLFPTLLNGFLYFLIPLFLSFFLFLTVLYLIFFKKGSNPIKTLMV